VKQAFIELEKGQFMEGLNSINQTFGLFGQLVNPSDKEREARICSTYKLALKLLIAKAHEPSARKVAIWCRFLAELVAMQPKHRIICARMAIKSNMDVKNYGVAARFIEVLLPLNLMDKSQLEAQHAVCKENNMQDQTLIPYTCPACTKLVSVGLEKCSNCQTPVLLCHHTLEIITTVAYYQCTYCLAILSGDIGHNNKCTICLCGNLTQRNRVV